MPPLTPRERRALRARGHHLQPVVHVGQGGIHEPLLAKLGGELAAHELVKVKVGQGAPLGARETGPLLAEAAGAELVQVLGRTILLWRARPQDED